MLTIGVESFKDTQTSYDYESSDGKFVDLITMTCSSIMSIWSFYQDNAYC